jgi:membrane fusion protein, heavy metal efflux system
MNRPISITIFFCFALFADGRVLAANPLLLWSEQIAGKAPNPADKEKDESDEKGSAKNTIEESSPIGKDQAASKENNVKEDAPKEPGSTPNGQDSQESAKKSSNQSDIREPNELGRVELDQTRAANANLQVEVAGPAKIQTTLPLYGKIGMNEDAVANVSPRFPGLVRAVSVRLGDQVQKGQVLAVVESNDSLRNYQVTSEINGTIIKKDVTVGEVVRDDKPIFTVADLSTVWIDFSVFPQDFERIRLGQTVHITYAANVAPVVGKISYIAPIGSENTQSLLARAVAQNSEGLLRPGLFVMGDLQTEEVEAPVAVFPAAIQTLNEKIVIFAVEGKVFAAREVKLGARDDNHVQVLAGLNAGDRYVSANSFLLKAELGKPESGDQD